MPTVREDRNQFQIIRKDARNCFVESLNDRDVYKRQLIMLGEGGVEWRAEDQAAVALPPLNMNLARYLVIPAIKSRCV